MNLIHKQTYLLIFIYSFTILYVELSLIRYLSAHILYLGFFTIFVLISSLFGIGLGLVTPNNTKIFPQNYSELPEYIYEFRDKPDWIILYSKRGFDGSYFTFDNRAMPPVDLNTDYEEIILPIFFSDLSRPEIELHSFTQIKPEYKDQVFVYHLK